MDAVTAARAHLRWLQEMRRGQWESAWKQTDLLEKERRTCGKPGAWNLKWDGAAFSGRKVLVRCEHGLGDSIQFARFLPQLQRTAASLVTLVQPALVPLFSAHRSTLGPVANAWTERPAPEHEVEVECMELAYAFRATPASLAATVPYLDPASIRSSSPFQLKPASGRRVGLVWASSAWDSSRSVPLFSWHPVTTLPGLKFYSLQQGPEAAQAGDLPFPIELLTTRTEEILDAAAAMLDLDLVITVDTMAAHLAGALGRPVWLLLQKEADWRWMENRSDSPWYPAMRIFRQPEQGNWAAVLVEVARQLAAG